MKIKINTLMIPDILAYLALTIYLSISLLSTTFLIRFVPSVLFMSYIYITILLLMTRELIVARYKRRDVIILLVTIVVYVLAVLSTQFNSSFSVGILVIYFLRNFPFDKAAKISLVISVIVLFLTVAAAKFGFILNYSEYSALRVRHYLGFRYSLFGSTVVANIISIYIFLRNGKLSIVEFLLCFGLNFWIYSETQSRLIFGSTVILLIVTWIYNYLNGRNEIKPVLLRPFQYTYLILFGLSYQLATTYSGTDFEKYLNDISGGRIYLANRSLQLFGVGLTGEPIQEWNGNGLDVSGNRNVSTYLYVDNLYLHLLQRHGLLLFGIFLFLVTRVLRSLYKRKEYFLFILVVVIGFKGIIDDLAINLYYNIFWMLFGLALNKDYKIRSND
ncbi:hypothetical protein JNG37_01345 [Streptococcus suis]|uniref:Wzy n=1 Tax=Streptococcus suis TaxID=1307 RepID=A0A4T2GMG5_STRSU|nr:hypothetical protein [Streptococcus suis]MBM7268750.1 hypothetical protein [Streptococcus suis]MBM7269536.1 hypothetical protein [Streptococcus suis]TII00299.1 hypothetical protein FAJ39_04335 [Streptococcus suis]TII00805.1 hypothetical protein FAJ39_00255 [Streptococcus suis]